MAFTEVLLAAGLAFLATSAGSLGVVALKNIRVNRKSFSAVLAVCAGVMAYSAAEMLNESHAASGDAAAAAGFTAGALMFLVVSRILPHAHASPSGEKQHHKSKAALVAGAITIHNIPEGFAIASAFCASTGLGWLVTISIAFQDIPEGLLVSTPLACYGLRKRRCVSFGVLSGAVEFAAALAGYSLIQSIASVTPLALAFSAGAMLYVVSAELLPDAFKGCSMKRAAASLLAGLAAAHVLAQALGG